MSDTTKDLESKVEQIQQLLALQTQQQAQAQTLHAGMVPAAQMGQQVAGLQPQGLLIPVELPLQDGRTATGYLQFGADALQNIQMTLQQVVMQYPVKAYFPKSENGYRGNGGSWGRNNRRW